MATEQQFDAAALRSRWAGLRGLLIRFAFAYLALCALPFPLNHAWHLAELPGPFKAVAAGGARAAAWYDGLWTGPVVWTGEHVFRVAVPVHPGNNDTAYHYVQAFCQLILAAGIAVTWTILGRRRAEPPRLGRGLRTYIRFALAAWMIEYASFKVFKTQFAAPGLARLLQPVGEMSPMRLMWTFVGASEGYTVFLGVCELTAGLLLTFRRTALLGALASAAIVSHVLVLNLCYDVPVKLFSLHLLLMAVFVIAPQLPRLVNVLLLGQPVAAMPVQRLFRRVWLDRTAATLRTAVVLSFAGLLLADAAEDRRTNGDLRPKPPLYGIWEVEEFSLDGQVRPPLLTDAERWRRLIIDDARWVVVELMDQSRLIIDQSLDPEARSLRLTRAEEPALRATLQYEQPQPGVLAFDGTLGGRPVRIRCRWRDEADFPLKSRGFHWVNERPYLR